MAAPIAYRPRRSSLALRAVGLVAFATLAWAMAWFVAHDDAPSPLTSALMIVCGAYFLFVAIAFVRQIFNPPGLVADDKAFSYWNIWERHKFAWSAVSEFRLVRVGWVHAIGFDVPDAPTTTTRRWNRDQLGVSDFVVAHSFTEPADFVCWQLNSLRRKSLGVPEEA